MAYLKQFRKEKKLSQQEMAEILSISVSHYSKLEGGFVFPSFHLIKKIKEKFHDFNTNNLFKRDKFIYSKKPPHGD
ncbi:Helix-turn-helix domain-containing protein [Pilibacter termitis]|uniref:Helix-turn-helix domain-containing protein n=2 Tax=Pilibacter termitis TaxID=263852 RepID=A0A1T4PDF0_9ENTE|nr:Helix-turn-helix domain-containing protein [Pilibacter termitis]